MQRYKDQVTEESPIVSLFGFDVVLERTVGLKSSPKITWCPVAKNTLWRLEPRDGKSWTKREKPMEGSYKFALPYKLVQLLHPMHNGEGEKVADVVFKWNKDLCSDTQNVDEFSEVRYCIIISCDDFV